MDERLSTIVSGSIILGRIDAGDVVKLLDALAPEGRFISLSAFDTVLAVLESTSHEMLALALLAEIRDGVITGEGAAIGGPGHQSRLVDMHDVQLMRRIMIAAGGRTGVPVRRDEAEILFAIHDMTADAFNDPTWPDLFVKAVAHHALAESRHVVVPRGAALAPDPRLANRRGVFGVFSALRDTPEEGGWRGIAVEGEALIRALVTNPGRGNLDLLPEVAQWLMGAILRDGRQTAAEQPLVGLSTGEWSARGPDLSSILTRAA